jgi:hypothetical protein
MAWGQWIPTAPKIGSDFPRAGIATVLHSSSYLLSLATLQLTAAISSTCEVLGIFLLSFTICRLAGIGVLLLVYLVQILLRSLSTALGNIQSFLQWNKLIESTDTYRRQWAMKAQLQLEGKYIFRDHEMIRVDRSGKQWMNDILWHDITKEFLVGGARVRFAHLTPAAAYTSKSGRSSKRPIVFLHGSRSWSYMWRRVCLNLITHIDQSKERSTGGQGLDYPQSRKG